MISDLLDVTRLGADRLAIERVRVDLMALLERVIERFSRDGDHPIELRSLGGVSSVDADPGRLEQILENLISNALKYRELNTRVVVAARHRDNEIEVAVTNSGAGISAAELPGLFTRFYRTASANRNGAPGLGLGLYITRELVQAHGGRVWVESLPGQQTTFGFTLPVHT